jgi:YfiH family protein
MMQEAHEEPIQTDFVMRQQDVETKTGRVSISALVCKTLEQAGFLNAFSTRLGGVSSLPSADLSLAFFKGDSKENTDENRRRFLKAISAENVPIVSAKQTHSTERCTIESKQEAYAPQPECDALITRLKGVLLGIQTADCLPILIADTRSGVFAAIHAGWRGTAGRITERTISDLMLVHGVNPRDCLAALGPAACVDCYEVGDDVIERYKKEFGYWHNLLVNFKENGKAHLDVREANIQQLRFCGFSDDRIHVAEYCTMHQNELFFSYRKEGKGQPSGVGRSLSVIGRLA